MVKIGLISDMRRFKILNSLSLKYVFHVFILRKIKAGKSLFMPVGQKTYIILQGNV